MKYYFSLSKNQIGLVNILGASSRIEGGGLALGSLGYNAYVLGQDGFSSQDIARLTTQSNGRNEHFKKRKHL